MKTEIIYEDAGVLVIYKPAGIATQSARIGQQDVVSEMKNYIRKNGNKFGNAGKEEPYLGVIHRLDQPVEGLLVFAGNPKAAAGLTRQLQQPKSQFQEPDAGFCKYYYAVLYGLPTEETGELEDWLCKKDGRAEVTAHTPEARIARLRYSILQTLKPQGIALADIQLETGRFHQIRAQMAHNGTPLLGDLKYGSEASRALSGKLGIRNVALCAYRLEFTHPVTGKKMHFEVKPKGNAFSFFSQL